MDQHSLTSEGSDQGISCLYRPSSSVVFGVYVGWSMLHAFHLFVKSEFPGYWYTLLLISCVEYYMYVGYRSTTYNLVELHAILYEYHIQVMNIELESELVWLMSDVNLIYCYAVRWCTILQRGYDLLWCDKCLLTQFYSGIPAYKLDRYIILIDVGVYYISNLEVYGRTIVCM